MNLIIKIFFSRAFQLMYFKLYFIYPQCYMSTRAYMYPCHCLYENGLPIIISWELLIGIWLWRRVCINQDSLGCAIEMIQYLNVLKYQRCVFKSCYMYVIHPWCSMSSSSGDLEWGKLHYLELLVVTTMWKDEELCTSS